MSKNNKIVNDVSEDYLLEMNKVGRNIGNKTLKFNLY